VEPSAEGLGRAIREALDVAKVRPQEVNLVIPHGLGGVECDLVEAQAIKLGLGEDKGSTVPVLPIQGGLGHCGAASGGLDLAAAVLAIEHTKVPAATNCRQPCPKCGLNIAQGDTSVDGVDIALLSGYTIGGQSAALVVKRFTK
jgi:3-oxoacyl-[acyl-carrier-protein] synthase II